MLFHRTLSTSCEKCEVATTARQKMSHKAAKFPTLPGTLPTA